MFSLFPAIPASVIIANSVFYSDGDSMLLSPSFQLFGFRNVRSGIKPVSRNLPELVPDQL
jgi:hypothetical protein